MHLALAEARRARGSTSPNPPVGAVVVCDGLIVGRGYTRPPGGPHAEVVALTEAGTRARGATLFVTLEPCNVHGRTPPCTDAIIAAGIAEVHCAMIDPDSRVRGGGVAELERAGVRVTVGDGADEAAAVMEDFIVHRTLGRPLVVVKFAASLDGRIASVSGESRWITGEAARAWVHAQRALHDAIMAGSGTVRIDDPLLTARPAASDDSRPPEGDGNIPTTVRQPLRVVVDSRGRTSPEARVLGGEARTLIATTPASPAAWRAAVTARGGELAVLPAGPDGRVDLAVLLRVLAERGVMSVLVEGGATLLGALFDAGLVDKVHAFIAPLIIGGAAAPAVAGAGAARMADVHRLHRVETRRFGEDVLISGSVARRPQA